MGGGLMQLVAYGAQDIYLTGNPQITFFKVVYRRHTNFSMEAIQQTINGNIGTGASNVSATISRNGDLVSNMYLEISLDRNVLASNGTYANWTNNTGHALIDNIEVEIGGQLIDKHYSQFLDIYNELTDHDEAEWSMLNKHAGKDAYLTRGAAADTAAAEVTKLFVPLKFWFNRNPGLALPLIALQYHEVKVKLATRAVSSLVNGAGTVTSPTTAPTVNLWVDYIYLDTDERRRFAQQSHEYLIEQVQREQGAAAASLKLNFNHPVKELMWVIQDNAAATSQTTANLDATLPANDGATSGAPMTQGNDWFNYECRTPSTLNTKRFNGDATTEPFNTIKIELNGHDRFAARDALYFRTVQPYQSGHKVPTKHIYSYSFALKPEEHQPSGSCNFSRIDNAKMVFTNITASPSQLSVYAINYNVLRIMSGMGGLAYSN
jgi:hypothetical protein